LKQKAAKGIPKVGTAVWLVAQAVPSFWLGGRQIFVLNLRIFSPNQLQIPFFCFKTQYLEYLFLKLN